MIRNISIYLFVSNVIASEEIHRNISSCVHLKLKNVKGIKVRAKKDHILFYVFKRKSTYVGLHEYRLHLVLFGSTLVCPTHFILIHAPFVKTYADNLDTFPTII